MNLLLLILPALVTANKCAAKRNVAGQVMTPVTMGVDPTTEPPKCVSVNTGACAGVLGTETLCVEKPPSDKTWTPQQYMDLMSAFDSPMVMPLLVPIFPTYVACNSLNQTTNGTAEVKKKAVGDCQEAVKKQALSSGCNSDLKKLMCLAGARPCEVVDAKDPSTDKRSSAPCEWCTKMVAGTANGKANGCSSTAYPFDFKGFYGTDEATLCYDLAKELAADASMVTKINALGTILGKDSLKKKGRTGPDIDIAGMFAWGMDSAVRGCSPKQCPVANAGIATGLFDKATTKFVAHQCPERNDEKGPTDEASSASTGVVSMVAAVCSTVAAAMVAL